MRTRRFNVKNFRTVSKFEKKTDEATETRTMRNKQLLPASQPTWYQRNKKIVGVPHASLPYLIKKLRHNQKHPWNTSLATFVTTVRTTRRPRSHEILVRMPPNQIVNQQNPAIKATKCVTYQLHTSNTVLAVTSTERIGLARVLFPTR